MTRSHALIPLREQFRQMRDVHTYNILETCSWLYFSLFAYVNTHITLENLPFHVIIIMSYQYLNWNTNLYILMKLKHYI